MYRWSTYTEFMGDLLDPPSAEEAKDLFEGQISGSSSPVWKSARRILLIDDTESVLNDYRRILCPPKTDTGLESLEDFLFDEEESQTASAETTSGKKNGQEEFTFELESATQGEQGYELALSARERGEPFQLAFVDMRMPPGWDGLQTIQALMRVDPEMQFIISTAYSDFTWAETMERLGYEDSDRVLILKKPFDTSEVWQLAVSLSEKWFLAQSARVKRDELEHLVKARTSELLKTQNSLVQARNEAIEASQAKSRFLAGMSHEIRTPLNAVVGISNILNDLPMPEEQKDMVKTLNTSADHLLTIINDILEFSKIEAGRVELESIRFDLQTCINDIIQLFGRRAHEKGIGLWSSYPFWVPTRVIGDPTRLKQILTNLVSNAIKFTETGQVFVSVKFSEGVDGEKLFTISVEDSGIGIPDSVKNQLFEEYTQADSTTTRRFGGTGLGLQISSKLSTLMGGNITVDSTPGKGSCFSLTVPFAASSDPDEQKVKINTSELETRDLHVVDIRGDSIHLFNALKKFTRNVSVYQSVEEFTEQGDLHELDMVIYNVDQLTDSVKERCGYIDKKMQVSAPKIVISHTYRNPTTEEARPFNIRGHITMPVDVYEFIYALTLICRERIFHVDTPVITRQLIRMRRDIPVGEEAVVIRDLSGSILLAEDNIVNQRVSKMILKRMGLEVDIANNGAEAVEKARIGNYDCILMDCQMPEMDGLEATESIRKLGVQITTGDDIPIVAMTACVVDEEIKRCYEVGMNDYLS
ncbi:MAG: response regulator, partial [Verrucomicrobiota bacterium]